MKDYPNQKVTAAEITDVDDDAGEMAGWHKEGSLICRQRTKSLMRMFQLETEAGDDYSNQRQPQKLANKTLTPQTREGLF